MFTLRIADTCALRLPIPRALFVLKYARDGVFCPYRPTPIRQCLDRDSQLETEPLLALMTHDNRCEHW